MKALDHQKQWLFIRGVSKFLFSAFSKSLTNCLRKCARICAKICKMPLWMHCRKDNKNKCKKRRKLYQKPAPKGEPRTRFSHPKVHLGGPLGSLGSKTLPTQPQDLPKQRFLLICVPSGVFCHWFVVHISENCSQFWCSFLCFREWTSNETCKWNKQWTPFQKGTVAGLRAALLDTVQ